MAHPSLTPGRGSGPWSAYVSMFSSRIHNVLSIVQIHNIGWAGLIRVDGTTYRWLGAPLNMNATTTATPQITPTRTILTVQAGPMQLTATFLTPIEVRRILSAIICDSCFHSHRTGSANLCPSPTCLSRCLLRTANPTASRSTQTSAPVRFRLRLASAYPGTQADRAT